MDARTRQYVLSSQEMWNVVKLLELYIPGNAIKILYRKL